MKVTVYEVGPRDGLQALKQPVETSTKIKLIDALYNAGLKNIEETSFAHPKLVPQMADAEDVFQRGGALVMNKRGYDGRKLIDTARSLIEKYSKAPAAKAPAKKA